MLSPGSSCHGKNRDIRRKLNRKGDAIKEYVHAADLFAERGFDGKALAQYNLAFRLDSSNEYI
jgi:hypothetical protein